MSNLYICSGMSAKEIQTVVDQWISQDIGLMDDDTCKLSSIQRNLLSLIANLAARLKEHEDGTS